MNRVSMGLAAALLAMACCGCRGISRACHQVGDFFAPAALCEFCGGAPCVCPPPAAPLAPLGGPPAVGVTPDALAAVNLQLAQLSEQYQVTRTEMDQMRMELQGRSQELIGTRAQLESMENQVAQLSDQMNHWNSQLAKLEGTLRENDQQQNQLVNQLTQSVARLADRHESATSEMVIDAIER